MAREVETGGERGDRLREGHREKEGERKKRKKEGGGGRSLKKLFE